MHFPKQYSFYLDKQAQTSNSNIQSSYASTIYIPQHDVPLRQVDRLVLQDIFSRTNGVHGKRIQTTQIYYEDPNSTHEVRTDVAELLGIASPISLYTTNPHVGIQMRKILANLHQQNILHYQEKVVYWSMQQQRIISPHYIQDTKRPSNIYYVRYFIDTKKHSLIIPIDRIHTLFADVAIAVNPLDKRFKKLIGKKIIVPIINRIIPIVADEAVPLADPLGIKRVIPAHDIISHQIALRHNLPTNIYAYDEHGVFTEHATIYAGKKFEDFQSNIVQYLNDIHNLDRVESDVIQAYYHEASREYIEPFLMGEWVVDITSKIQSIQDFVHSDRCQLNDKYKTYLINYLQTAQVDDTICISNHHKTVLIPHMLTEQGSTKIVTEYDILQQSTDPNTQVLAMLIFSLIHDSRLPATFTIDELCDSLLALQGAHTVAQVYIQSYLQDLTLDASMHAVLKAHSEKYALLQEDKKDTKRAEELTDQLDNISRLIYNNHKYIYSLPSSPNIQQRSVDIHVALYLCAIHAQHEKNIPHYMSFIPERNDSIQQQERHKLVYTLLIHPTLDTYTIQVGQEDQIGDKNNFLRTCEKHIRQSGSDAMRLAFLYDDADMQQGYDLGTHLINKLRNAARYVYTTQNLGSNNISLINLHKQIQDHMHNLTEFDTWILYRLQELKRKYENYTSGSLRFLSRYIMQAVIDDICVKYIEVAKQHTTTHTSLVMVYVIAYVAKLVHPIIPSMTYNIRTLYKLNDPIDDIRSLDTLSIPNRDYKIHLLMNIIGACLQLKEQDKYKKHQAIDIYIQAPADMNQFIQNYEAVIQHITRAKNITYNHNDNNDTSNYHMTNVIDMQVGIKLTQQNTGPTLASIQHQLQQKQEYLQHMRSLASFQYSPDREHAITNLKSEIDQLELQLYKLKAKK